MGLSSVIYHVYFIFCFIRVYTIGHTSLVLCDLNSILLVYMLGFVARRLRIA